MADGKQFDGATEVLSLTTTVGSLEEARKLASALVEQRLAACVQLEPALESHYRWEGSVCAEPEVRLTVKTAPERLAAVQAFMAARHPYQLPQLLWQTMSASAEYARWVREETAP